MTSLLLALILAAAAAPAAEPAAAPATAVQTDEFVLIIGQKQIGSESVSRTRSAVGEALQGQTELTTPAGTVRFAYGLELTGGKATNYELKIVGSPASAALTATATAKGWRFEATQEGVDAPPTVVERPVAGPAFVIDNNLAAHLDLLTRTLDLAPGGKAALTAVVPQALQVFPFEVVRLDDEAGARRYRLTMASVLIELVARAGDGALLEARVPLQNAVYRRKGWQPAPVASGGADAREREIVVPSPAGDLPAVLVVPRSDKPAAAVLLLSGSGPNDRDETIGPNKPLRDIAVALADRGIATLRFAKRTHVFPAKAEPTLAAEYLDDAAKALEILRSSAGIDPKRIVVAGHSLGGTVAPVVAARAKDTVRGLILLAPAVRRIDEIIVDQIATQVRLAGLDEAAAKAKIAEVAGALAGALDPANASATLVLGAPAAYWREVAALDVVKTLTDSPLPFLVLQGEKDIQARADLDFAVLAAKLGDAKGRATYKLLPGLNHLFMKVDGASTGAEYAIAGRVAPEVAETMAAWVDRAAH